MAQLAARVVPVPGLGPRASAVAVAVTSRLVLANAFAALFVAVYLLLTDDLAGGQSWQAAIASHGVFYATALVVFTVASLVEGRRLFVDAWRWLDEGRRPTGEERRRLLALPVRIGLYPLRYWALGSAASAAVRLALDTSAYQVVAGAIAVLLGGLGAAALGFFIGERTLRPVVAEALAGDAPEAPVALGLGRRLLLAWALGTGVPLLGVVATPFVLPDSALDPKWAMAFLGLVGIVAGLLTMGAAARSIAGPVGQVRQALARVGEGDLDTEVVVDDPGELGQLQAGVNEMVRGLRERARIEDLFGRHVGQAVARKAVREGPSLGGEVRPVSALFVDLRGSTELSRRLPPDEVVALLNRFFAAVVAACDAEGGWLDSFEGDGALCVFGAPTDRPDHADRALRAARRMAEALAALRAETPDLDAGIGVSTGAAVAGHVGTESRLEYTVIGLPVNLAARLTTPAKERPGRVVVDAATIEAASPEERCRWAPGGPVDLKGLPRPLAVYEPAPPAP